MNLNGHKRKISPQEIKNLIEKTELIAAENLGLIICEDGQLYHALKIYREAYLNYTSKELLVIMVALNKAYIFLSVERNYIESACNLNNKRLILDILNSLRLTMEPTGLIKSLVKGTKRLFAKREELRSSSFDDMTIKSFVSIFGFRTITAKINFTNKEGETYLNYGRRLRTINEKETFNWGLYDIDEFKKDYCKWIWKAAGTKKNNQEQ
jgi:hypothetical protein